MENPLLVMRNKATLLFKMMNMKNRVVVPCLAIVAVLFSSFGFAADFEFVASVNGVPITKGLLDLNLKNALAQGQKDTPALRKTLIDELINRELVAQAATKEGLEKNIDLPDQITQLKQH